MTNSEYESLQQHFYHLIEKAGLKYGSSKERDAYINGIYACKSALCDDYKKKQSGVNTK